MHIDVAYNGLGACRCHDGIASFCVFMNDFAFFACCSEAIVDATRYFI